MKFFSAAVAAALACSLCVLPVSAANVEGFDVSTDDTLTEGSYNDDGLFVQYVFDPNSTTKEQEASATLLEYPGANKDKNNTGDNESEPAPADIEKPGEGTEPISDNNEQKENGSKLAPDDIKQNTNKSSDSSVIPENANTFDSGILILCLFASAVISTAVLVYVLQKRRRLKAGHIAIFVALIGAGLLLGLRFAKTVEAETTKYVADENSPSLSDIINSKSLGLSGTDSFDLSEKTSNVHKSGFYTYPGTENDENPIVFAMNTDSSYAGNLDNKVIFGGACWQVSRTSAEGDVKLVYFGKETAFGDCLSTNDFQEKNSYFDENYDTSIEELVFSKEGANASGWSFMDESDYSGDFSLITTEFYGYSNFPSVASFNSNNKMYDDVDLSDYANSDCYAGLKDLWNSDKVSFVGGLGHSRQAYCSLDDYKQFYGSDFEYRDGHYYLVNGYETETDYSTGGIVCDVQNGGFSSSCNDEGIQKGVFRSLAGAPYKSDWSSRYDSNTIGIAHKGKYICRESYGAKVVDSGTVDCGESIEYHSATKFGSYQSGLYDIFSKITGAPNFATTAKKNSDIRTKIESWYKENLASYDDKLADDVFCIADFDNWRLTDDGRVELSRRPYSLKDCDDSSSYKVDSGINSTKLKYPVALLDKEEIYMLFGSLRYSSTIIASYPSSRTIDEDNVSHYSAVGNSPYVNFNALPAIYLRGDVKVVSGNGTSEKPYIIDGEYLPDIASEMKTIRIDDDAAYNAVVDELGKMSDYYDLSYDDSNNTVTLNIAKPMRFDFKNKGLSDLSFLSEFPYIVGLDARDNELTEIPKINLYANGAYYFGGNHLADLGYILEYLKAPTGLSDKMDPFRQFLIYRYADKDNITNPPIVRQYLDRLGDPSELASSGTDVELRINNIEFLGAIDKSRALDEYENGYLIFVTRNNDKIETR